MPIWQPHILLYSFMKKKKERKKAATNFHYDNKWLRASYSCQFLCKFSFFTFYSQQVQFFYFTLSNHRRPNNSNKRHFFLVSNNKKMNKKNEHMWPEHQRQAHKTIANKTTHIFIVDKTNISLYTRVSLSRLSNKKKRRLFFSCFSNKQLQMKKIKNKLQNNSTKRNKQLTQ